MIQPHRGRRKRAPAVSCNVCRSRKVRCDRKSPCTSCVRHKSTAECRYDETAISAGAMNGLPPAINGDAGQAGGSNGPYGPPGPMWADYGPAEKCFTPGPRFTSATSGKGFTSDVRFTSEPAKHCYTSETRFSDSPKVYLVPTTNISLISNFTRSDEVLGVNPIAHAHDRISFYRHYSSVSFDPETLDETNHGPFAWHSIVRADAGLTQLWNFMLNLQPTRGSTSVPNVYSKTGSTQRETTSLHVLGKLRQNTLEPGGHDSARDALGSKPVNTRWPGLGVLTSENPLAQTEKPLDLPQHLLSVLPTQEVVWFHVDRFFRLIYPFFPYLDESSFRCTVTRIFGCDRQYIDVKFCRVLPTKSTDYAVIGTLCVVLRMSYLSLFSNDPQQTQESNSKILSQVIGIETVDIARRCLAHYQGLNQCNLHILQLSVFVRIYMEVCPENNDGPGRDVYKINNALLVQNAYMIGLNREPDKMPDVLNDAKINHLRRKLWIFIQFKDVLNALKFGSPYNSVTSLSDTKFPSLTPENSNCNTPGVDECVEQSFSPLQHLIPIMRDVANIFFQVEEDYSMADLVQKLNILEVFLFENMGSLKDCKMAYENMDRVPLLQAQIYIPIHVFLLLIYFRMFGYYEKKTNNALAFFYCKKLMALVSQETLPNVNVLFDKPHPYFEFCAQMVLNPDLEFFIHRATSFIASFTVRLGNQIVPKTPQNDVSLQLKYLMRTYSESMKVCLLGMLRVNHRYRWAWRVGVIWSYLSGCVCSENFYEQIIPIPSPTIEYSDEQATDLVRLVEPTVHGMNLQKYSSYVDAISEVIKSRKNSNFELFNPTTSTLFEDMPANARELVLGPSSEMPAAPELPRGQTWYPFEGAYNFDSVMEAFFEGADVLFDAMGHDQDNRG